MGDGCAKGALLFRSLDVDVDPLVVAGEAREGVDVLLSHLAPLAGPDRLSHQRLEPLNPIHLDRGHGRAPYRDKSAL